MSHNSAPAATTGSAQGPRAPMVPGAAAVSSRRTTRRTYSGAVGATAAPFFPRDVSGRGRFADLCRSCREAWPLCRLEAFPPRLGRASARPPFSTRAEAALPERNDAGPLPLWPAGVDQGGQVRRCLPTLALAQRRKALGIFFGEAT